MYEMELSGQEGTQAISLSLFIHKTEIKVYGKWNTGQKGSCSCSYNCPQYKPNVPLSRNF